jgi:hypothetical protein
MRLQYEVQRHWPPLAWLAECRHRDDVVRVLHGVGVEVRPELFCEGIWDAPFAAGDLDRTDLVFGSGARVRGSRITFVSSGATVDRLHVLDYNGTARISNSLPCALAAAGAGVDPTYARYIEDFISVIKGQDEYKRFIPTSLAPLRLVYFRNLTWNGTALSEHDKPNASRKFSAFEEYREFLSAGIGRCLANARDDARERARFTPLGTLSSGYDSPTVAVLGRDHGLTEVISFAQARGGWIEDGTPIAAALGLRIVAIDRDAWRTQPFAEVPFLAADGRGEDVFFSGAGTHLRGRILLTGFHGDKIWDKHTKADMLDPLIKRGDQSGTTLTEYRLWTGFIHFPVPFMGVRAIADIHRISNAESLRPWDVPGKYSRPICRRLLESAGVPRQSFGTKKKAASVLFNGDDRHYSAATRAAHSKWCAQTRRAWIARRYVPPHWVDRSLEATVRAQRVGVESCLLLARAGARVWPAPFDWFEEKVEKHRYLYPELLRRKILYRTVFAWAVERAIERYTAQSPAEESSTFVREPEVSSVATLTSCASSLGASSQSEPL